MPTPSESPAPGSLVRATWRALLKPRRLVPILVVCVTMVWAQDNPREPMAVPLGTLMCTGFVMIAPVSWRVLNPQGLHWSAAVLRLLSYACVGLVLVYTVGYVLPAVLRMRPTFLTVDSSLAVLTALFCVGGWGLGRDIAMEDALVTAEARAVVLQKEAERAQLMALRSHLDPHFLFNTLNAIAEWCRTDGEVAERAVLQLSAMLREVLGGVKAASWPLGRELELLRTLFALHLLRDPGLFELTLDVPEPLLSVEVPPLMLLPLAENAVKHGPAKGHRGPIALHVREDGAQVVLTLENPGAYAGPRDGGEGVPMVEKRLALAYGPGASLRMESVGARTRATVTLPSKQVLPGVTT
jgi:sensor histidine kinase YesM